VIDNCRILEYAIVAGKESGPVPRLAIGEPIGEGELILLHCDKSWRVVGMSAHPSVRQARQRAERAYPGVTAAWVDAGISKAQAEAYVDKRWKGSRCSFCGRRPDQISQFITKGKVHICDVCIREYYATVGGSA
jgi:hypothetical protein